MKPDMMYNKVKNIHKNKKFYFWRLLIIVEMKNSLTKFNHRFEQTEEKN